ncbi:hypothetical protein BH11PLA1_BH11PLA1_19980 [soil metagenome]
MNATTKAASTQCHNLILYRKALHPELFTMRARKVIQQGSYELEAWAMNGSHMLRFQRRDLCLSELVTDREGGLPTTGVVTGFPCVGERDYTHPFASDGVSYITTMHTESLSANLYRATYQDMLMYAEETDAMLVQWRDGGEPSPNASAPPVYANSSSRAAVATAGKNMTVIDIQRSNKDVNIQCFHLIAQGGFVLRTATIFEHE